MISSQRGQSLVMTLVSVGITGILVLVMASMFDHQRAEIRSLSEKLGANDLGKAVIAALADGTVCRYVLNNPVPLTFNSTAVTPTNPQVIDIRTPLYASINPGPPPSPGAELVKANPSTFASAFSNTLWVNSIRLSIHAGSGATYLANWQIGFDQTKLVRAIQPISVLTTLTVDNTNPTAARIVDCQNGRAGSVSGGGWCHPDGGQPNSCPSNFSTWGSGTAAGACTSGTVRWIAAGNGNSPPAGYAPGFVFNTGFICVN